MIQEAYCSFETANLLKEKGFNEECWGCYEYSFDDDDKDIIIFSRWIQSSHNNKFPDEYLVCSAPTQQMACRWLREVHSIHIQAWCPVIDMDADTLGVKYNVVISNLKNKCIAFDTDIDDNEYNSYEEAIESAIMYCVKNLI